MLSRYINPYTDFGFKKLFGEEANKDLLTDFRNTLLPDYYQIAELSFKNPNVLGTAREDYSAIFGIYCDADFVPCGEPLITSPITIGLAATL
ncbi:MAG: Rpn family recombination-promoting nuclease/putative transposase [Planctomycetaceae bacterium]|jgi:hypothetical protein|nr:Rpn family recombination-promoting nuclease/putative transposase [Planctomycetaceae bacterium]